MRSGNQFFGVDGDITGQLVGTYPNGGEIIFFARSKVTTIARCSMIAALLVGFIASAPTFAQSNTSQQKMRGSTVENNSVREQPPTLYGTHNITIGPPTKVIEIRGCKLTVDSTRNQIQNLSNICECTGILLGIILIFIAVKYGEATLTVKRAWILCVLVWLIAIPPALAIAYEASKRDYDGPFTLALSIPCWLLSASAIYVPIFASLNESGHTTRVQIIIVGIVLIAYGVLLPGLLNYAYSSSIAPNLFT